MSKKKEIEKSFNEFKDIFNELGNKKISELRLKDIAKYLLLAEEFDWIDANIGDNKVFYKYDKELLEDLSYSLEDVIFKSINEDILYNNDLHTSPKKLEKDSMDIDEIEI